jgi:hypothetical protein
MHASCSTCSDLSSINVPAGRAKATCAVRDLSGSGSPGQQSGTAGLVTGYHGQRAEAGR